MAQGLFALSGAQQRLWYMNQLEPDSPFYNITLAITLDSDIDKCSLFEALKVLVRRHDILHTRYPLVEGKVMQEVADAEDWCVESISSPISHQDTEEQARTIAENIARYPVDLEHGPVFRAFHALLDEDKSVLVLLTHHIATDQSSINILTMELDSIYQDIVSGMPISLPPTVTYKEYVDFELQRFNSKKDELYKYWDRQLAKGFFPVNLPYDAPLKFERSRYGKEKTFFIEKDQLKKFRSWCRKEQATEFAGLLTLWSLLIGTWSNQQSFFIATTTAFREKVKFRRALGCFVNTLVIHQSYQDTQDLSSLLRLNEDNIIATFEHRAMTYERLVERNRVIHHENIDDPVNVYIQYQPRKMSHDSRLSNLFSPDVNVHNGRAKFPVLLNVSDWDSYLHCTIEYEQELFFDESISILTDAFNALVDLISLNPQMHVSDIVLLLRNQYALSDSDRAVGNREVNSKQSLNTNEFIDSENIKGQLSLLWQQHLGTFPNKDDNDFFLEGGNSLLLTQLLWYINKKFKITIPLREIYHRTRYHEMANLINTYLIMEKHQERQNA